MPPKKQPQVEETSEAGRLLGASETPEQRERRLTQQQIRQADLRVPSAVSEVERAHHSVCEKKPLVWEEDLELFSRFFDRKEKLNDDHTSYVTQHPELKAILADFVQMLLLRKPRDVFSFAHDFFIPFDSQRPSR